MGIEEYGATFRFGIRHDRDDGQHELHKIQVRRRMRIALEAADAFEHAIREKAVFVRFAASDDEALDPLDMAVEFIVGEDDARIDPVFTFNLRDAFLNDVRNVDYSVGLKYRVVLRGLEALVTEMRAEMAMFETARAEDEAERGTDPSRR